MKKVFLGALILATITFSCSNPSENNKVEDSEKTESLTIEKSDTISQIKAEESIKEEKKTESLPKEFFSDYSWTEDLELCGIAPFSIYDSKGQIGLSNGTEWGGYDVKVEKNKDYYTLNFEQRSEGESFNAKILLKMVGNNLFVSTSGKSSDFTKVFRCK